jgi:spermidine synthase
LLKIVQRNEQLTLRNTFFFVYLMGFSGTVSQVFLVREFMILFAGNELTLGVILVNWLLCIALGGGVLGRLVDRITDEARGITLTLILIAVILPTQILYTRAVGTVMGVRGENVDLFATFYISLVALFPFGALYGLQFALGSNLDPDRTVSPLGRINRMYIGEAVGSVLGGLAFTYVLVHHLHVLEIAVALGLANLIAALHLQRRDGKAVRGPRGRGVTCVTVSLIALYAFGIVSGHVTEIHVASYSWQWQGMTLRHYENSAYGNLVVTAQDGQCDFWLDGMPLFSSPDPDTSFIEEVTHFPLLQHPSPKRVLLIGGGVGGVLEELLKHSVSEVYYVELDPALIRLARQYIPDAAAVLDDPRVEVVHADGRTYVQTVGVRFDIIMVNLPSPSTLQLNRFYTVEFFEAIRAILDDGGVFSTALSSSLTQVIDELRNRNRCVYETVKSVFPACSVVPGDTNIFLASENTSLLTIDADRLYQRLLDRGVETRMITKGYLEHRLSPEMVEGELAYLLGEEVDVNRDLHPIGVYHDLGYWNAMFYPYLRAVYTVALQSRRWWFVVPIMVLVLLVALRRKKLMREFELPILLGSSGFAGMTFNIVLIFTFQAVCGSLYQELGIVTAAFMLGLAVGGLVMTRTRSGRQVKQTLARIEATLIAFALLLPIAITALIGSLATISLAKIALPVCNVAAGLLVGLEFPLASKARLQVDQRVRRVAGSLYAYDLVGGAVGAILASVWMIPLLGVAGTCILVVTVKAGSLYLLTTSRTQGYQ